MSVSEFMGLQKWDSGKFSHYDLVQNFQKIDSHDHTPGNGTQLPTAAFANSAFNGTKIAVGSIDSSKVTDASLTEAKVLSPNTAAWKLIDYSAVSYGGGTAPGPVWMVTPGHAATGSDASGYCPLIYLNGADYAVAGKTVKLNLELGWSTTAGTAIGTNITVGLYPLASTAGGTFAVTYSLGSVIAASQVSINAPASNSRGRVASADFSMPVSDIYIMAFTWSAAGTVGTMVNFTSSLYYHYV